MARNGTFCQESPRQTKPHEDVNGEKVTVKKYGGFLVPIFHGLRRVFHGL